MDFKCYHGSQRADIQLEERPIYLIDDKQSAIQWANGYAFGGDLQEQDEPTLYTIEVTFNNPLYIKTEDEYFDYMDITAIDYFLPKLKEQGYDGVIFDKEYNYDVTYYMPINAKKQCKIIKQANVDERELEEEYNGDANIYKQLNKKLIEILGE